MRELAGLWLWEAWRGRGASSVREEGLTGRNSSRESCRDWRGRGGRARSQRAAGGSGGSVLEVKWVALC